MRSALATAVLAAVFIGSGPAAAQDLSATQIERGRYLATAGERCRT
jgi:hypothetical protein